MERWKRRKRSTILVSLVGLFEAGGEYASLKVRGYRYKNKIKQRRKQEIEEQSLLR